MTIIRLATCLIFVAAMIRPVFAAGDACQYTSLEPIGPLSFGNFRVELGDADDVAKPTAWQGPIVISRNAERKCTVDPSVSLIERPLFQDGLHLLVTTYSGSERTVFSIALGSCKILWRSQPFAGDVRLDESKLYLGKAAVRLNRGCLPQSKQRK
jgi:hypothetical protein